MNPDLLAQIYEVSTAEETRFSRGVGQHGLVNDQLRCVLPFPARSGGGRLTGQTPAVQPRRREGVKVPDTRPWDGECWRVIMT